MKYLIIALMMISFQANANANANECELNKLNYLKHAIYVYRSAIRESEPIFAKEGPFGENYLKMEKAIKVYSCNVNQVLNIYNNLDLACKPSTSTHTDTESLKIIKGNWKLIEQENDRVSKLPVEQINCFPIDQIPHG